MLIHSLLRALILHTCTRKNGFVFHPFLLLPPPLPFLISTHAANFKIVNNCPCTVRAAASLGSGRLDYGQTWNLPINPGSVPGRIWVCTGRNFDAGGHGNCLTRNCTGGLNCTGWAVPLNTLTQFALNQFSNLDFYDISLVDGFNIPMDFYPLNSACRKASYMANINGQCPKKLKVPGGCNNLCIVFKATEYRCTRGLGSCIPVLYSRFFIVKCPDAYSVPRDGPKTAFTCPSGSNYRVVFCPLSPLSQVNLETPGNSRTEY